MVYSICRARGELDIKLDRNGVSSVVASIRARPGKQLGKSDFLCTLHTAFVCY